MDYEEILKNRAKELESAIEICLNNNTQGKQAVEYYIEQTKTSDVERKKILQNIINAYVGSSFPTYNALEYYKELIEINNELVELEQTKCVK